jgi:hypothetical protein
MVSGPQINRVIANWYMGEYFNNVQTQTNYADPGSKSPDPYTAYYSYSGSEDRAWDCQVPWGWVGDLQVVATLHTLTNEGRFTMDSVVVSNGTWQYETVNTYGTSLLLVRIHDTDRTLSRPMAQVMVSGGPANPAMALYWLLKNKELGLGVSDDYIDELSFMEAAAKLDQVGYRFDRAYCSDSLIQQVITDICMAGRLVYCEIAGRHAIYFDEETPVEYVRVVDLENYASNIQFGEKSLFDTPNRFVIKYVDIHNDYTLQDMIYDDVNLQQEIGCVNEFTINLAGTANADHAWQLGWYYAMYANHTKTLSFTLKPILWDLTPGTIFRSTSQFNPYLNNREWVVQSIEESELYTYVVSCIEYPRTAYHVSSTYVPDDPYVVNDPPPPPTDPGAITATAYIHFTDFVTPTLVDNYHVRVNLTIEYVSDEVKQLKLYKKADADTSFTLLTTFPQGTTEFKYTYVEDNIWQTVEWRATGIDSEGTESPLDLATRFQYYLAGNPEAPLGWGEGLYGLIPYDLSQPIESEPVIEPEPDPLQQGGVGV